MADTIEDLDIYSAGNETAATASSQNSQDDTSDYVTSDDVAGMIKTALSQLTVPLSSGAGSNAFNVTNQGLYLGSGTFASAPFSVTMAGVLTATGAIISGSITATSGTIGGWSINTTYISSGGVILTSGASASLAFGTVPPTSPTSGTGIYIDKTGLYGLNANTQNFIISASNGSITAISGSIAGATFTSSAISSSNYVSGSTGWTISNTGNAEFNNLLVRGELHTSVLSQSSIQVTAGSTLLALSGGSLRANVTTVTSPTTFNVDINDPPSGHVQVFAVSDILRIKDGSGNDNWMTVSSVSDQTTFFRYVCTKNNGTNATFRAGAAVADYGQSGQGLIFSTVDQANAPYISVQTQAGSPWSSITEQVRIGQLNGVNGFISSTFGISIGQVSTGNYLTYDTASGKLVINGSPIANQDTYGDGADGTVTFDGTTSVVGHSLAGGVYTQTRDVYFINATVNSSITVNTASFNVYVNQTGTNNGFWGPIGANGGNGGNGGNGVAATPVGGTGGTAGDATATAGATGTSASGNLVVNAGLGSSSSSAGGATANTVNSTSGSAGGRGGASGNCVGEGGTGTAGAAAVTGAVGTSSSSASAVHLFIQAFNLTAVGSTNSVGGTGGGSGPTTGGASGRIGQSASGGGGGGGGTGLPGGFSKFYIRKLAGNGVFSAHGGNGGTGGNAGTSAVQVNSGNPELGAGGSGGGGGGAGGNGGGFGLIYSTNTSTTTFNVAAGSGGNGGTGAAGAHNVGGGGNGAGATGSNGSNGTAGTAGTAGWFYLIQI